MVCAAWRDFDGLRALHYVKIRQDVPLGVDDETGARAFHRHRIVEKIILDRSRDDICNRRRSLPVDPHIFSFGGIEARFRAVRQRQRGVRIHGRWSVLAVARPCPIGAEANDQANRQKPYCPAFSQILPHH